MKMTEQEAAALVVAYLEGIGLDVYQEVGIEGVVADIVALRGPEIWIVEVKTGWSLDLLDQLHEHKRRCRGHRLYAAVPMSRNDWTNQRIFQECGFGTIIIRGENMDHYGPTKCETVAPRTTSKPLPHILKMLHEGHKTHAKAGAIGAGGRWTPFRQTCETLASLVRERPGIFLAEAMRAITHHYSSDACARSSMAVWLMKGKIPGIKLVQEGRYLTLHPAEKA